MIWTYPNNDQAAAVWCWLNYLRSQVPAGKIPLLINIDEAAICRFEGHCKGTVSVPEAGQRVSLSKRRESLSHEGVLCDRPEWRRLLPQYILGSGCTLPGEPWRASMLRGLAMSTSLGGSTCG